MYLITKKLYVDHVPTTGRLVLAGDIGGTNSNFGLCLIQDHAITLLISYHTHSKTVTDFADLVAHIVNRIKTEYGISLKEACFGAAGAVGDHHTRVKPTNLDFVIDLEKIKQKVNFERVALINDFEIVGYGIPYVSKDDLMVINEGTVLQESSQAIVGAGTGVGKAIFAWSKDIEKYLLIPSEGGHADFAPQTDKEIALVEFIKKEIGRCNVSWEDVLSGYGIGRIYKFLSTIKLYTENGISAEIKTKDYNPDTIFSYWRDDKQCHDTFIWYSRFYGICAKNFTLEALARGGLYIAGGIASKNKALFTEPGFMDEFINCGKQAQLLREVPITLICDYNVSLYGAAAYLLEQHD